MKSLCFESRFNLSFECTADSIVVGPVGKSTLCLTYQPAQASRRGSAE